MTGVPKSSAIEALAEELASLSRLLGGLEPDQWSLPTPCPGWTVHDQVAHIIGTESVLAGIATPPAASAASSAPTAMPETGSGIADFNNLWVAALAGETAAELTARLADVTAQRLAELRAMGEPAWDEVMATPAGRDTYGRFMRIRIFDCWIHEQDIRDATGRPGHDSGPAVDFAVDETLAALGLIVGKRAGAPSGTSLTLDLTGPAGRTVHVLVADRATIVAGLDEPATTTLTMPVGVYTRLSAGRTTRAQVRDQIDIAGDTTLGEAVLQHLAFTI